MKLPRRRPDLATIRNGLARDARLWFQTRTKRANRAPRVKFKTPDEVIGSKQILLLARRCDCRHATFVLSSACGRAAGRLISGPTNNAASSKPGRQKQLVCFAQEASFEIQTR